MKEFADLAGFGIPFFVGWLMLMGASLTSIFGFGPEENRYQRITAMYCGAAAWFIMAGLIWLTSVPGCRP